MTESTGPTSGEDPRRWRVLVLLSLTELFGMSAWFSASALAPHLIATWNAPPEAASWLTTAVQLGFVFGTALAAILNLADVVPAKRIVAVSAAGSAVANGLLLLAPGLAVGLALRFLTGAFMAGVYPPAMKMAASWFRRDRGLAIGALIGAITLGGSLPHLIKALVSESPEAVIGGVSAGSALAALVVTLWYRDGPHAFPRRPFRWSLAADIVRHQPTRLAIGGYLGHMWELYAMWTWIPVFLASVAAARGADPSEAALWGGGAIAIGAAGCVWGGRVADRIGRERLVNLCMGASGACALVIGLTWDAPLAVAGTLALVWGFFVVADSAQFSTLVTEVGPPHAVGTALTLQTSIGFLLTMITIEAMNPLIEVVTWRWAFAVLAVGPLAGILAIRKLARLRRSEVES